MVLSFFWMNKWAAEPFCPSLVGQLKLSSSRFQMLHRADDGDDGRRAQPLIPSRALCWLLPMMQLGALCYHTMNSLQSQVVILTFRQCKVVYPLDSWVKYEFCYCVVSQSRLFHLLTKLLHVYKTFSQRAQSLMRTWFLKNQLTSWSCDLSSWCLPACVHYEQDDNVHMRTHYVWVCFALNLCLNTFSKLQKTKGSIKKVYVLFLDSPRRLTLCFNYCRIQAWRIWISWSWFQPFMNSTVWLHRPQKTSPGGSMSINGGVQRTNSSQLMTMAEHVGAPAQKHLKREEKTILLIWWVI